MGTEADLHTGADLALPGVSLPTPVVCRTEAGLEAEAAEARIGVYTSWTLKKKIAVRRNRKAMWLRRRTELRRTCIF